MEIASYMIQNAIRYVQTTNTNQNNFVCYRKCRNFLFFRTTFVMIECQAEEISTLLSLMQFALR